MIIYFKSWQKIAWHFLFLCSKAVKDVQIEVLKNMTSLVFTFSMKFSLQTYVQSFIHNPVQIVIHCYYCAGSQDAILVEDSSQYIRQTAETTKYLRNCQPRLLLLKQGNLVSVAHRVCTLWAFLIYSDVKSSLNFNKNSLGFTFPRKQMDMTRVGAICYLHASFSQFLKCRRKKRIHW